MIKIEELQRNDTNVNEMDDVTFNDLVAKIQDRGFDQPIKVWFNEDIKKYEVIKGNHRYEAAKLLKYEEVPCIVGKYKDRDDALADGMSDNVIRGKMNPDKFTKEWLRLKKIYGTDKVMSMMSLSSQKNISSLIKEARTTLPDEMKKDFDKVKDEIKDIDDLALILNTLFKEYGHTLKCGYMFFNYGGVINLMIRMEKPLKASMEKMGEICESKEKNINEVLLEIADKWLKEFAEIEQAKKIEEENK